jgi:hypothetical protein
VRRVSGVPLASPEGPEGAEVAIEGYLLRPRLRRLAPVGIRRSAVPQQAAERGLRDLHESLQDIHLGPLPLAPGPGGRLVCVSPIRELQAALTQANCGAVQSLHSGLVVVVGGGVRGLLELSLIYKINIILIPDVVIMLDKPL